MKAITLYQPFAQAIVLGLKAFETRPRQTHIRGRIAVHAALKDPLATGWMPPERIQAVNALLAACGEKPVPALPRGVVVGTVELVDCLPVELVRDSLPEAERLLGDYGDGRFAWQLRAPVLFDHPFPARGSQGWWNWEPAEP